MRDVEFRDDGTRFKLRAELVVAQGGRVLVTEVEGHDFRFLPGGKVRLGEASRDAAARELREELGIELPIQRLLYVSETQGDDSHISGPGTQNHQVAFGYLVDGSELTLDPSTWEAGHRFRWMALDDLADAAFRPRALVPLLRDALAGDGIHHVALTAA